MDLQTNSYNKIKANDPIISDYCNMVKHETYLQGMQSYGAQVVMISLTDQVSSLLFILCFS